MTTETTEVMGLITEDEQPPIGSVMLFSVAKGQIDPRSQTKATKRETFDVELLAVVLDDDRPEVKVKIISPDGASGNYPPGGFFLTIEHWNEIWAPRIDEVRFPASSDDSAVASPARQGVASCQGDLSRRSEAETETQRSPEEVEAPPSDNRKSEIENRKSAKLVMVRISDVAVVAGHNARRRFDAGPLLQLSQSITSQGMIEPIILNKVGGQLRLVAGERRLRAAKLAGEQFVEAKVYENLSDRQAASMALAENFDRIDLDHIETAHALAPLRDAGATVAEIAAEVHKSTDYVREHLDLLRLAEPVQDLVGSGRLPIKQAAMIARVGDRIKQIDLAERATRIEYDDKAACFCGIPLYDIDYCDFVMPMSTLRDEIARAMLGLAACGWPMDAEFADRRSCTGCPDNSATYADQPALFAGVNPRGSAKKGHCTNESCYLAKEEAWQKVRAERIREAEKKQKATIKKAKAAGLDVCAECGKVAEAGAELSGHDGDKLCPKCIAKAEKRALSSSKGGRGESWEAKEKRIRSLRAKFPWTAEQKFAKALRDYGKVLVRATEKRLAERARPEDAVEVLLLLAVQDRGYFRDLTLLPSLADIIGGGWISEEALASIWRANNEWANCYNPCIDYGGEVENVPLPDEHVEGIEEIEALAAHWGVEDLPERPTMEAMEWKTVINTIVKGKRPDALAAIAACEETGTLEHILLPKLANGIAKVATWRVKAIEARIAKLRDASSR